MRSHLPPSLGEGEALQDLPGPLYGDASTFHVCPKSPLQPSKGPRAVPGLEAGPNEACFSELLQENEFDGIME